MVKENYYVIGVMSGTSLDGIDLCYVHFEKTNRWKFNILVTQLSPYSESWQKLLEDASLKTREEIDSLNDSYTNYLAQVISQFINEHKLSKIDAICSHGHTILHQPEHGLTLQIGNKSVLSSLLNQTVVCDFRVQDVQLGGQGAPLVPIGDSLLFSDFNYCLNLGGFANISFNNNDERIAFDICPVNTVLNFYAHKLGYSYDKNGELARNGEIQMELLQKLNELEYYALLHPKSLGIEWVQKVVFPLLESFNHTEKDFLATFVEHIAVQISNSITTTSSNKILVTGGGAFNGFLIERIQAYTPAKIVLPKREIIENKEALIFGLLGVLKLRNEINCLASVTGASKNHSSGMVFKPEKQD